MYIKKVLSWLLSAIMLMSLTVPALAAEVGTVGNAGNTPVELTAEASVFDVTVPTSIAFHIDANADVTCPSNLRIVNGSAGPVEVTGIEVQTGDWIVANYNNGDRSLLAAEKVGANKFGLALTPNGGSMSATVAEGTQSLAIESDEWLIGTGSELAFDADAIATAVDGEIVEAVTAANVVFTIGWKVGKNVSLVNGMIPGLYDINGVMLCTWEESGIDVEKRYDYNTVFTESTSGTYVLTNRYPTAVKVVVPNGITDIGACTFYKSDIESVILPDGVCSIGLGAFESSSINSIIIPDSLVSIDMWAFEYCQNNLNILYKGSNVQWYAVSKGTSWDYGARWSIIFDYAG